MAISINYHQTKSSQPASKLYSYANDGNDTIKGWKKSGTATIDTNDVKIWCAFFTASVLLYLCRSSGDFSALLVFASLSRLFGFAVLNLKIWTTKKATGISTKTLQLYCLVFLVHNFIILVEDTYIPYDDSATMFYNAIGIMSLVLAASALYAINGPFKQTDQEGTDNFGEWHVPSGYGALYIVVPCFITSLVFHPQLAEIYGIDILFAFTMYVECVAILPQLHMFQKKIKGRVEMLTAHFVFALGLSRVLEFTFWYFGYVLFESKSGSHATGYLCLFSQVMQILLMLDFFWYYCMAVKNDMPLILPSTHHRPHVV
mmetsp:Transcript_19453/g.28613  ORF Transcript_19453/g.28613 Transcript_19453/m.28613 type:complete len:316 (+) Transcript_19453:64-1011(+)|eukprot:CAMPEP_0195521172 /NCGR_PEP_ID=MMETSP0794_2-20130614/18145_1 /TAXON_ID=515487 /ORGANISM="Stephanopyxis turris, Strain CCMP 815" /LENGTH=315 /DNA_ID=CAMNT_0040650673 /DNA_START=64 /DNA_END=1011 /DNA_ORIENTATION=+